MDILDQMTKSEIMAWIRSRVSFHIQLPKMSELLFIRYQNTTVKLQRREKENIFNLQSLNSKRQDEYAKEFNACKDTKKQLSILQKMKPYEDKLSALIKESQKLSQEYEKLDKLYERVNIEREKENL